MADVNINSPLPEITTPSGVFLNPIEEPKPSSIDNKPLASTEKAFQNLLFQTAIELPEYAKPNQAALNAATYTDIIPALRYTDAGGLGYTPFDPNLENKYGRKFWGQNLLNNLAGFGSKAIGAAVEGFATIPLLISGIGKNDYIDYVFGDNDFSNYIHDWTRNIDENLPIYRTNYENEHPFLKYISVWDPVAMSNTWGSTINNLGFTVGAIGGAMIETALITAATGGVGFFPALGAQVAKFTSMVGRIGRTLAVAPKLVRAGEVALGTTKGLRFVDETVDLARNTNVGMDMLESKRAYDQLRGMVTSKSTAQQIKDLATYQLGLVTSARGEGVFEGSEVYHTAYDNMISEFYDEYGRMPEVNELSKIHEIARNSANITVGANMALLYLSNKLNWGTLFKPTSQFIKGTTISGWGKNIGISAIKQKVDNKISYELVKTIPQNTISKIFLNAKKLGNIASRSIGEGIEEGSQFALSQSSIDYAMKKYNINDRKETVDYMTSLIKGLEGTVTTNEGWDNIMAGFVGGILGGGVVNRALRGRTITAEQQLEDQVNVLNKQQLGDINTLERQLEEYNQILSNSTYKSDEGLRAKIDDLSKQLGLAREHEDAIKKDDIKRAKDIQADMSIAYWTSAQKNGLLEARKEELDILRGLEGESFNTYWGMDFNEENVKKANSFLDKQLVNADRIAKNYQDAVNFAGRNPFNKNKNPYDYKARELYVEALAHSMSRVDISKERLTELKNQIKEKAPLLDLTKAIQLTSNQGLRQINSELTSEINRLNEDIEILPTADYSNRSTRNDYIRRRNKLEILQNELAELLGTNPDRISSDRFVAQKYIKTLKDLWYLRNGISLTDNEYINDRLSDQINLIRSELFTSELTDEELAETLQSIQDMYQLAGDQLNFQRHYNYLKTNQGETDFSRRTRKALEKAVENARKYTEELEKNPPIDMGLNVDDVENIRQEEYENIDHPEDLNTDDKVNIRNASRKDQDEWTEEEALSVQQNLDIFEQYREAEKRAQERIAVENTIALNEMLGGEFVPTTTVNKSFVGLKPEILLQGLFLNNFYLQETEENMTNMLFNSSSSVEDLYSNIQGQITQRSDVFARHNVQNYKDQSLIRSAANKPETEWTKEEIAVNDKYPEVISDFKSAFEQAKSNVKFVEYRSNIDNSNYTTNIYRQDNFEVITLFNNGKIIGELRNPNNLYYRNEEGNLINIFNNKGQFILTPSQYSEYTLNSVDTYNSFKNAVEKYAQSYNTLFKHIDNTGKLNKGEFKNYFNIELNPGSVELSSNQNNDISLKDVSLKKQIILDVSPNVLSGRISSVDVSLNTQFGYTKQEAQEVVNKIIKNPQYLQAIANIRKTGRGNKNFMVAVFPMIGNQLNGNSFLRVRQKGEDATQANFYIPTSFRKVFNNTGVIFNGVSVSGFVTEEIPAIEVKGTLVSDLKVGDYVKVKKDILQIASIEKYENGAVRKLIYTNGKEVINLSINPTEWRLNKVDTPIASFLSDRVFTYTYGDRKYTLNFNNDIDKALFIVARSSSNKNALYDKSLAFLQDYFNVQKDYNYTEQQLINIGQVNIVEGTLNKKILKNIDALTIEVGNVNYYPKELKPSISNPYNFVKTNNITNENIGEKLREEIENRADITSTSFGIIRSELEKLGYIIEEVNQEPNNRKAGTIYFVDNDYIAFTTIDTNNEVDVSRRGIVATDKTIEENGINSYSLWETYRTLYKSPFQRSDEVLPQQLQEIVDTINDNESLTLSEKERAIEVQTDRYFKENPQEDIIVEEVVDIPEQDIVVAQQITDKQGLNNILKSGLFGDLNDNQVEAFTNIMNSWVKARITDNTFENEAEGYAYFKYGGIKLFNEIMRQRENDSIHLLFNQVDFPDFELELQESKKKNKYPLNNTNLPEELWHVTKTPSFKKWFGKSVVVDENGDPLVQWHWSPITTIEAFNLSGIGTHVGTKDAANHIKQERGIIKLELFNPNSGHIEVAEEEIEGKFYPLFVSMQNPLPIEDFGQHDLGKYYFEIQKAFEQQGITLTEEDLAFFNPSTKNYEGEYTPKLKELLNKYGYDGFIYNNLFEDFGEISYIIVNKADMKLVSAKAFDPKNENIYNQVDNKITLDDIRKCL